jgi:hypothetical protein
MINDLRTAVVWVFRAEKIFKCMVRVVFKGVCSPTLAKKTQDYAEIELGCEGKPVSLSEFFLVCRDRFGADAACLWELPGRAKCIGVAHCRGQGMLMIWSEVGLEGMENVVGLAQRLVELAKFS